MIYIAENCSQIEIALGITPSFPKVNKAGLSLVQRNIDILNPVAQFFLKSIA